MLGGAVLLVLGLVALTVLRAAWRQARAEARFPPTGSFLNLPDGRLHYRQAGQGPDVLLLHGASGSIREFDFGLFDALAARYRVTAIDRPGLGYSTPLPGGDASLAGQVTRLAQAAERLGLQNPLIVGQSFGGSVALAWALRGGPSALVLLGSPALPWPGDLDIWYRLNRGLLRPVMPWLAAGWIWPGYIANSLTGIFTPNPVPPGYAETIGTGLTIRRKTLAANVAQVLALRAQLAAMEPDYPRLTLPIEWLHGEDDAVVPIHVHARPFAALVPHTRLTALPQTGHMPHHTQLPQVLAAIDRAAARANMLKTPEVTHGPAL